MRFIHQGLSELSLHTRQADVKASSEEVGAVSQAEIDFGLDGQANRDDHLSLAGRMRDGAFRDWPTRRPQRIAPDWRRYARSRELKA